MAAPHQPSDPHTTRGRQAPTAALFVRIPTEQAKRLDRAAFELSLPKQTLVSGLLERYLDSDFSEALRADPAEADPLARRGVTVETRDSSSIAVGRHSFRPRESEVLTAEEVAELLQVDVQSVLELSDSGQLPGRKLGEDWRFAKAAVLRWLAGEDPRPAAAGESEQDR
jgi:excisionase family DNA binding protein